MTQSWKHQANTTLIILRCLGYYRDPLPSVSLRSRNMVDCYVFRRKIVPSFTQLIHKPLSFFLVNDILFKGYILVCQAERLTMFLSLNAIHNVRCTIIRNNVTFEKIICSHLHGHMVSISLPFSEIARIKNRWSKVSATSNQPLESIQHTVKQKHYIICTACISLRICCQ